MIRRDILLPGGKPGWLLISQIEHARLSGALASEWGAPPFAPVAPRDELLPAIVRHDDGWCDWERRPQVDPATGWPRNFLEMPIEDSLLIWRASIERAALLGPFSGATVAGHFLQLLRHATVWEQHGTRVAAAAHQWEAEFESLRRGWLDEWSAGRPENTSDAAAQALAWLQWFDRLSLWFCVTRQTEPAELPTCGGPSLSLTPQQADGDDSQTVALRPWPLRVSGFEISLSGRLVPARRYRDSTDLAAIPRRLEVWRLRLIPG